MVVLRPLTLRIRLLHLPLETRDVGAVQFSVGIDDLISVCVHLQGVRPVEEFLVVIDEGRDILMLVRCVAHEPDCTL